MMSVIDIGVEDFVLFDGDAEGGSSCERAIPDSVFPDEGLRREDKDTIVEVYEYKCKCKCYLVQPREWVVDEEKESKETHPYIYTSSGGLLCCELRTTVLRSVH